MTTDELKLLISLHGNKRIPYLEEEIFSNADTAELYAIVFYDILISTFYNWAACQREQLTWYPQMTFTLYSANIMGERWFAVEKYIKTDKHSWFQYKSFFGI